MSDKEKICGDTVFRQLFIEMRRYRDLEHRIVTWWTTILVAIMAAFVGFGRDAISLSCGARLFATVFVLVLASVMWLLMRYSNKRYHERWDKAKEYYPHPALRLCPKPRLFETCILKSIRMSGFQLMQWAMGIITLGFCIFLWWIPTKGAAQVNDVAYTVGGTNMLLWQTIGVWFQAIFLLGAVIYAACYARAARQQVDVTQEQVEATLAGRAGLFVNDPLTAEQFMEHSARVRGIEQQPNWEHVKDEWLVIEVTNGGDNAMNVRLCAKWKGGHESAEWDKMMSESECVSEIESMVNNSKGKPAEGAKQVGTWQVWQLRSGESMFVCSPRPDTEDEKKRVLGLIWWAPGYLKWSQCIQLEEKDGKWGGNWSFGKPLRDEKGKAYWPRRKGGKLPPPK